MKPETIPFPRQFQPGSPSGVDMRAVKRALAVALGGPNGMSLKTNTFAKPAQTCLVEFKKRHGLLDDPIYTQQAHDALTPFFDEYGASLMNTAYRDIQAVSLRGQFRTQLDWMLAHRAQFDYAQVRPIPLGTPHPPGRIRTDCSGSVTIAAYWAGVSDPNGLGYSGAGNTGTMLHHCLHVPEPIAGDLIVYRRGTWDTYGHHVVAVLDWAGNDGDVFSHGHQGTPERVLHSVMLASQASRGYGTWTPLRWLPVP